MKCPVLVGRDAELAQLRSAMERAAEGSGSMLVLVGGPGVGRSRSIGAAQDTADELGLPVFSGRAVRASTPAPLRPLSEALLAWLRRHDLPLSLIHI